MRRAFPSFWTRQTQRSASCLDLRALDGDPTAAASVGLVPYLGKETTTTTSKTLPAIYLFFVVTVYRDVHAGYTCMLSRLVHLLHCSLPELVVMPREDQLSVQVRQLARYLAKKEKNKKKGGTLLQATTCDLSTFRLAYMQTRQTTYRHADRQQQTEFLIINVVCNVLYASCRRVQPSSIRTLHYLPANQLLSFCHRRWRVTPPHKGTAPPLQRNIPSHQSAETQLMHPGSSDSSLTISKAVT